MSSFIAHSIVGLSVSQIQNAKPISWKWRFWITFLAITPDFNYLALWILGTTSIFKYSHSIGFVIILPILSILFLKYKKVPDLTNRSVQLLLAPISHLLLDLLVGVWPKMYLWPFYSGKITLPFGILPSAGKLDLQNYYLYRNLLIELGIILPIIGIITLCINHKRTKFLFIKLIFLLTILIPFIIWGVDLPR